MNRSLSQPMEVDKSVCTSGTPPSKYSRRTRFATLEFDPLLDSSSINAKGWGKIAKAIERMHAKHMYMFSPSHLWRLVDKARAA
jgi:hypothetical protein